jgi:hypothetical protein
MQENKRALFLDSDRLDMPYLFDDHGSGLSNFTHCIMHCFLMSIVSNTYGKLDLPLRNDNCNVDIKGPHAYRNLNRWKL